jgi:hypothetical protein
MDRIEGRAKRKGWNRSIHDTISFSESSLQRSFPFCSNWLFCNTACAQDGHFPFLVVVSKSHDEFPFWFWVVVQERERNCRYVRRRVAWDEKEAGIGIGCDWMICRHEWRFRKGGRTKDLYARFLKSREADDSKSRGLKIPGLRNLAE